MSTAETRMPPKYDPRAVGQAALFEVIQNHPASLTVEELVGRIASDPDDFGEVDAVREAVRDLRRAGLARYRDADQVVEPTQAALRAHALFSAL